jgi:hypothetical protein
MRRARRSMSRSLVAATVTGTLVALGACGSDNSDPAASTVAGEAPSSAYEVDPANFAHPVENPYFPLKPGTTRRYRGSDEGRQAFEVFSVTSKTKTIQGVKTRVITDRLYEDGKLHESTEDWYVPDREGTVWYFGEATMTIGSNGKPNGTSGSWEAGVDGAEAGIFMPAKPKVGQAFRQEFYKGEAEDKFKILSLRAPVKVPYVSTRRAMLTTEFTRLEPGAISHKYYVRGVGQVLEQDVRGGNERLALVSVKRG